MQERVIQFRVGVMVAATLMIVAILIVLLGEKPAWFRKQYVLYITFADAPGVRKGTPIRKSGILIGRVEEVKLLDEGGVEVTAKINHGTKLDRNEVCQVNGSLLGDAWLRFMLSPGKNISKTPIKPGAKLDGVMAPDPVRAVADLQRSLSGAIDSVAGTSSDVSRAARRIDQLLAQNEERIGKVIAQTDQTLSQLNTTLAHTDELISDPELRSQLKETIAEIPQVIKESRATIARMDGMFEAVERNLGHVEDIIKPLGQRGDELVGRIDHGLQNLEAFTDELAHFARAVNSGQGSLGKLLNDDELYRNLNTASRNLKEASIQLRPIISDARVFSDKIARHPGVLIREAVRPGPGTKGVPRRR